MVQHLQPHLDGAVDVCAFRKCWPAALRLALHGGKVSSFLSSIGLQFGGSILHNRLRRTRGPPSGDSRHPTGALPRWFGSSAYTFSVSLLGFLCVGVSVCCCLPCAGGEVGLDPVGFWVFKPTASCAVLGCLCFCIGVPVLWVLWASLGLCVPFVSMPSWPVEFCLACYRKAW
jgi:hypothetical protein